MQAAARAPAWHAGNDRIAVVVSGGKDRGADRLDAQWIAIPQPIVIAETVMD